MTVSEQIIEEYLKKGKSLKDVPPELKDKLNEMVSPSFIKRWWKMISSNLWRSTKKRRPRMMKANHRPTMPRNQKMTKRRKSPPRTKRKNPLQKEKVSLKMFGKKAGSKERGKKE